MHSEVDDYFFENEGVDTELNRLSRMVIGAAIAVHRELGPGLPEEVYERALEVEFQHQGVRYSRQHSYSLMYRGVAVGSGRMDFLVEGRLVVELKTVEAIGPVHRAQVLSYLRANRVKLGVLINFNVKLLKEGIRRYAL
jgi:GxxExxY protein